MCEYMNMKWFSLAEYSTVVWIHEREMIFPGMISHCSLSRFCTWNEMSFPWHGIPLYWVHERIFSLVLWDFCLGDILFWYNNEEILWMCINNGIHKFHFTFCVGGKNIPFSLYCYIVVIANWLHHSIMIEIK